MLVARRLFGWVAGCAAGVVAAVGSTYITSGQEIMSDAASVFLVLLACYLCIKATGEKGHEAHLLVAGLLAGLAVAVSYSNLAVLAALLVALLLLSFRTPRLALRRAALFALAAVPWGVALAGYQWLAFGSPLQTGYGYWVSSLYGNLTQSFSLSYLQHLNGQIGNLDFYGRVLLSSGKNPAFYPPVYVAAIALGTVALFRAGKAPAWGSIVCTRSAPGASLSWPAHCSQSSVREVCRRSGIGRLSASQAARS